MKRYTIELNEHQLRLIADCLEDCHRFLCGQTELYHTTSALPLDTAKYVRRELEPLYVEVAPNLYPGQSYDWCGNGCDIPSQRVTIAQSYYLYREIRHAIAIANGDKNVYEGPTLTCDDSGEPIKVRPVE